jgi:tetratricopeptide (TPR) repeat protein
VSVLHTRVSRTGHSTSQLLGYRSAVLLSLGKDQEALQDAARIMKEAPNESEGYYRLGNVLLSKYKFPDAEKTFRLGLQKCETDLRIHHVCGTRARFCGCSLCCFSSNCKLLCFRVYSILLLLCYDR